MTITILPGDVVEQLRTLPDCSVQCVVTSPPYYGLRNYGVEGQIGLEDTPEAFIQKIVEVFREVKRVLRNDGTLWLNFGDSYWANRAENGKVGGLGKTAKAGREQQGRAGCGKHGSIKAKDMIGIPWMVAFALRADGWYLRSDIIWSKPNPMPESVTDRPTKAHEYVFLLTKKAKYYYDADAIKEPATTIEERPFGCERARGYNGKLNIDENAPEQFKHKNLQPDGQPPQTMHLKRAMKQDLTGNPTYTGFNDRYAEKMARNGTNIPGHSGILKADGTPFCDGITRNARTVWTIPTQPTPEAHFATFPEALVEPCIKAGSKIGDVILDPFGGSGTTAKVARDLKRSCILIELNPAYVKIMKNKLRLNEQLGV